MAHYVGNNPVNYTDPTGHRWDEAVGGGLAWALSNLDDIVNTAPAAVECAVDPGLGCIELVQHLPALIAPGDQPEPQPGTTKLYRAVQDPELKSIESTGQFTNPEGIEVKYFSTTPEGATKYAQKAYRRWPDEGPYTLVETEVSSGSIASDMTVTVDRGIPSVVVPTPILPSLAPPKTWTSMPVEY